MLSEGKGSDRTYSFSSAENGKYKTWSRKVDNRQTSMNAQLEPIIGLEKEKVERE